MNEKESEVVVKEECAVEEKYPCILLIGLLAGRHHINYSDASWYK